jgi:hypothetical protein
MADKKSILEEALLDIKNIQSALNANTKEILRSVAREEIDSVVKESLKEEIYEVEEVEEEMGEGMTYEEGADMNEMDMYSEEVMDLTGASDEEVIEFYKKMEATDEIEVVGDELRLNISEPGKYIVKNFQSAQEIDGAADDFDEMGDDDMGDMDDEEDFEFDDMGDDDMDDMDGEDMESEDDLVDIDDEDDFEEDDDMEEEEEEEEELDEEVVYEIEMDDSNEEGDLVGYNVPEWALSSLINGDDSGLSDEEIQKIENFTAEVTKKYGNANFMVDDIEGDDNLGFMRKNDIDSLGGNVYRIYIKPTIAEETINELISNTPTKQRRAPGKANIGAPSPFGNRQTESVNKYKAIITESKKKYKTLLTETEKLKSENEEFRKALKEFRTKLVETVVFNSNLTYVTKLFMEHSTTKAEKENIMKRFDNEATTIKESKKLYKTIANELTTRKPINESVENKFSNKINTSGAKQLNERTAYVDPSTKRIIDLINRVENK